MGCVCCRPLQQQQPQLTLLLVGLDNGGKTTLVNALRGDLHGDTTATFGFSTHSIATAGGSALLVYDLGGGRGIRRIWQTYVAEVHGVVFVLDAADAGRFPEARAALHALLQAPQLAGKPLLVFANKQDRPGAASCEAVAAALQLESLQLPALDSKQHEQEQLLHSIVPCTAKAAEEQQAADPALQEGLQWLVSSIRPRYGQLQDKIDREAAAARLQEQLRRQEREQRAAANRAQREREEQEAAAATAAVAAVAVAGEKQQGCQAAAGPTAGAEAKLCKESAAAGEEDAAAGQNQQLIPAGWQPQAGGRDAAATAAAAAEVSQPQAAADEPVAPPPASTSAAAASGLSLRAGSREEAAQAAAAASQCSPSETPSTSPDKQSSLVVAAPGRQERAGSDSAATTPAASGRQPGPLGSLLSLLLLPGAATSSSLESLQFSDLKRAAEQQLETTPRVHSLTSEASSLCPEPSGLPGRGARAIAAATSRRAAALAVAARAAGPEARRRLSGAGAAEPSHSKAMMRSTSMPVPGADAAAVLVAGSEACNASSRSKGRGSLMAGNKVQPLV